MFSFLAYEYISIILEGKYSIFSAQTLIYLNMYLSDLLCCIYSSDCAEMFRIAVEMYWHMQSTLEAFKYILIDV